MTNKIELPGDDSENQEEVEVTHLDIIEAGIKQVDQLLQEQEVEIKKLNDAAAALQQRRIAAVAQKNLLLDLQDKFKTE
jgi:hypothetical protein